MTRTFFTTFYAMTGNQTGQSGHLPLTVTFWHQTGYFRLNSFQASGQIHLQGDAEGTFRSARTSGRPQHRRPLRGCQDRVHAQAKRRIKI